MFPGSKVEVSDVVRLILPTADGTISMVTAFLYPEDIRGVHREDNVSPDRIKSFSSNTILYVDQNNSDYREYLAGRMTPGELIRAVLRKGG